MASGSIVVDLLLRTGSFESDTGRAEKRLKQFEKNVVDTGTRIAAGIGAITAAIGSSIALVDQFAQSIGQYQDIADKIGDTASAVSSLQLAADQSGTALDSVAAASVKLTAALAKTDDESDAVAKALAAINIPLDQFKALSPVEQIDRVARALAEFEDGAGKTAVAVALFGRSGAEIIPFLNDLADAQERNAILTDAQIASADEFSKTLATMRSDLGSAAKVVAAELIPSFQAFLDYLKDTETGAQLLSAAGAVLRTVFETLAVVAANVAFVFVSVGREIRAIDAQIAALARLDLKEFNAISEAVKRDGAKARAELDAFERRILGLGKLGPVVAGEQSPAESRRFGFTKPEINVNLPNAELQKYLEGLQKQIDLTKKVSAVQKAQAEIASGALGKLTEEQQKQVLAAAKALDVALANRTSSRASASKQSEADRYLESLQRQLERTKDLTVTEQLLTDIQAGRLGKVNAATQSALVGLAEQIDGARALKAAEDENLKLIEAQRREYEAVTAEAARFFEQTRTPVEQLNAGLEEQRRILETLGAEYEETYNRKVAQLFATYDKSFEKVGKELDEFSKNAATSIQGLLGDSLFEAMNGNFKNIGDSFTKLLQRMVAESLATDITRALFGKAGGGGGSGLLGDALSTLGTFFGFGGAKAGGGDVMASRAYLVGEQGPEMFVPRTMGVVLPSSQTQSSGRSVTVNNSFTVTGAVDRRTQEQLAADVGRRVDRAMARHW